MIELLTWNLFTFVIAFLIMVIRDIITEKGTNYKGGFE